jgi:hypothetical protein
MREDTLRCVLLVKAIEDVDRAGTIIPPEDRAQATREAARALGGTGDQVTAAADDAFLARALGDRAERLVGPLVGRFPIVDEALGRTRTPAWLLLALLAVAVLSGIGLSALDGSRRINILAFPCIGLIAWNLAMYGLLAVSWVKARSRGDSRSRRPGRWAGQVIARRMAPLLRQTRRVHALLGEAIGSYAAGWATLGGPFIAQHLRRWLHLAASAVALGLIAGLYVRGTVLRYEAGWESTFLGPAQVQAILDVLFGPIAAWSGVQLPRTVAEVAGLRWTAEGGGGDAAPWIHLIALSLASYVVLPRLVLAGISTLALWRLNRARNLPEDLQAYAADALRGSGLVRSSGIASVTPYAYEPSAASLAGLERWLRTSGHGEVRLDRRTTLRYGEEDMAAPAFDLGAHRVADLHVVLMSLAATPEAENHGLVIAAARDAARRARPPAAVRIVVDESPYANRLAGDASLGPRLEERRRLWRDFVAGHGLEADILRLETVGEAHDAAGAGNR